MLCWLLRMGNAVLLHLHPFSTVHVELHPSLEPIWSEIGISQFPLDLLQFRFPMLWGTELVPFGTRAIQIWTRSIPVSLPKMRKWYQRRNRRMGRLKPSAITNILWREWVWWAKIYVLLVDLGCMKVVMFKFLDT